jgi:predicted nucleic acid-binding protein
VLTSARVPYLDTSALVKLVSHEAESDALVAFLADRQTPVSSELAVVELLRAAQRRNQETVVRAEMVLSRLQIVTLTRVLLERAARVAPVQLRSLDAIHLAAALELSVELEAIVTYDDRMADAARRHGIAVVMPGRG